MLNVGLIGTGYMGTIHLEELARINNVQVVAVADPNIDLAKKTAQRFNIDRAYSDYKNILSDPDIHVIHNCTPNKPHYVINKEALNLGRHVFSEKPLAMTLEEAEELQELAEKKGAKTAINFCYRYYPVVQEMAFRVRRGDAGQIIMVTGTWFQDWLSNPTDYSWRLETSESGSSNITADLGSHWFDLIQFVTGLKITKVIGDFATLIQIRKKPDRQVLAFEKADEVKTKDFKVKLEEYSAVLFRLSNGSPGSFTMCQACNGRKSDTEFQIYGSLCSFAWDHRRSSELWIGYREKPNEILIESPQLQDISNAKYAPLPAGHPLGYHDAILNLFRDYYDAVSDGAARQDDLFPSFRSGVEEMKVLNAIIKSVKTGNWENVALV